jgi:GNAT superfamily N-acetyltransferase
MPDATPDPVRLELLADHLDLVPTVARWHWREWGVEDDELDEATWTAVVGSRTGREDVPFTLVAFLGDELVGSLAVCHDDVDAEFADEGPWLSGMFVRPPARDLGIGRRLLAEAERRAVAAGHEELWAHSAEAERFYVRCGWEVVRPKEPMRRDAVVRRRLS